MTRLPGWGDEVLGRWLSRRSQSVLRVVDSHTAGNPTRVIVDGLEVPEPGRSSAEIREWLRAEADWARRRLTHEPRGGALTCAVLPLPAVDDSHDLRTLFLEPGSYPPMCSHCTIGLASVVHERGLASHAQRPGGRRLSRPPVRRTVTPRPAGSAPPSGAGPDLPPRGDPFVGLNRPAVLRQGWSWRNARHPRTVRKAIKIDRFDKRY